MQPSLPLHHHADAVRRHFEASATSWLHHYASESTKSIGYQSRLARTLGWVDDLRFPPHSRALDAGCGAGVLARALVERSFEVDACDLSDAMLELTARDDSARLRTHHADVSDLPFPSQSFDLAVALGLIPWVVNPSDAVRELARVLRPGGLLIVSIDNSRRLTYLLDPSFNPWLASIRKARRHLVGSKRRHVANDRGELHAAHSRAWLRAELDEAGLEAVAWASVGFGPLTMRRRVVFPESLGARLAHRFQALADRGLPLVRFGGASILALARKPVAATPVIDRQA